MILDFRLSLAEETPRTLTDDEWVTLLSIIGSVENKSERTVWEAFQEVDYYGGKEYESFKDEAKHQTLISIFKNWLLKELTPYYPANLDTKEILINFHRKLMEQGTPHHQLHE